MFKNKAQTKLHFIGIGGIGMSGIAEILLKTGYKISGSDLNSSSITDNLKNQGAEIFQGHEKSNITEETIAVVYSSAINEKNPEVVKAKELHIPLIRRAEMLAEIMRLKYGLAVAGTHGKTTTSSILATILHEIGIDPTHIIGGVVSHLGGNAQLGKGEFVVAEADESDGSFLLLNPVLSVITNIDNDHLDFYENEENIYQAFLEFSNKVPFYGKNILNAHDPKLQRLMNETKKPYLSFGIDIDADYQAKNLNHQNSSFDLFFKNEFVRTINISLPGNHNVLNCLGAIALAHQVYDDLNVICKAAERFEGVGRRLETLYKNKNFKIIDDYAHHPTELKVVLDTALKNKEESLFIFEPHRFTRTRDCWDDFIEVFKDIKNLYFLPIYAASEEAIEGITSKNLTDKCEHAVYIDSWEEIENKINEVKDKEITVYTFGAGAIGRNIRDYVKRITT